MTAHDDFLESLPESAPSVTTILVDFLNDVVKAPTLTDVHIAAGIALNRLTGQDV